MPFTFMHQPLKGIYIVYQLLTTLLIRIPWWTLRSLPRSWRPRTSWSLNRVLRINLLRHMICVVDQLGIFRITPNHLALETDVGANGVWIEPVPHLIVEELQAFADTSAVDVIRIPGYWMHKDGIDVKVASPLVAGEKVVYHLHGGAYVRCSAHPSDKTTNITRGLLECADLVRRTFSVEYRLSSTDPFPVANPFPAALIDALAGYNYLVNVVGLSPADIIVVGDSAGGNLAHALTRYLVENQNSANVNLPAPPGALVLFSPKIDMSDSHSTPGSSTFTCLKTDCITPDIGAYSRRAFLGPHGFAAAGTNRYISPACRYPAFSIDFKGFPRTLIVAGGAEILVDEIRTMRARMVRDLGEGDGIKPGEGKVRYIEEPDAAHDYVVFEWHEPERTNTLKEVARWIAMTA
ncbi:hypothetical protein APHAL10511_006550 [Amanita phalloides]|nr:hypothetical protein APHAL10511_006550 [Amanita phalloides]